MKIVKGIAVNIDNSSIGMKNISLLMLLRCLDSHRINLTFPEVNRGQGEIIQANYFSTNVRFSF